MQKKKERCSICDKEAKWIHTPYTKDTLLCDEHAEEFRAMHGIGKPVPPGGTIPPIIWPVALHRLNLMTGATVEEDPGITPELLLKLKMRDMKR